MNDTCEEARLPHRHTAVYVYGTAASSLLSASLECVNFRCTHFLFWLRASSPLTSQPIQAVPTKRERLFASVGAGLDYDANRQMHVEQRNLKMGLISFYL